MKWRVLGLWLPCAALFTFLIPAMAFVAAPAEAQSSPAVKHAPGKVQFKRAQPRRSYATVAAHPQVTSRHAMLLIDAESGRDLEGHSADELRHPASLTKVMTLYLTFAALDSGQLRLGDKLSVSVRAGSVQPSKMAAPIGGFLLVRDAIMGLITRSANDAAVVLAEALAGDEDSFAVLMTEKARQLGMASTTFRNASGLPATLQVTTARDLARLAQAMLRDFPHYYPLFAMRSWPYGGSMLGNHNRLLASYPGADGLKTGYIHASGFNLVMSATRDNRRLIGVVLGGSSPWERDEAMADMMDRGFEKARALSLPAWQRNPPPPTARYAAASFVPGPIPSDRTIQAARAPGTTITEVLAAPSTFAGARVTPQGSQPTARSGSWTIVLGSPFPTRPAASAALKTAMAKFPDLLEDALPVVDALRGQNGRISYQARLAGLEGEEAVAGCRKLKAAKTFWCTAVAGTAAAQ